MKAHLNQMLPLFDASPDVFLIVVVQRKQPNPQNKDHRYTNRIESHVGAVESHVSADESHVVSSRIVCLCVSSSYMWTTTSLLEKRQDLNTALNELIGANAQVSPPLDTLISHISEMPCSSIQEQLNLLASIPNYHWWQHKTKDGVVKSVNTRVRYTQHLIYHPDMEVNEFGFLSTRFLPTSPRNQIIFFHRNPDRNRLTATVRHLLSKDKKVEDVVIAPPVIDEEEPPAKRRRKNATRHKLIHITPQTICERMNIKYSEVQSCAQTNQFTQFYSSVLHTGTLQWRQHSMSQDLVVMNEYDEDTGVLLPQEFVHVTAALEDGELFIKCTCKTYKRIHCLALQGIELETEEVGVLASTTCMHCRFFKTYLQGTVEKVQQQDTSTLLLQKVSESIEQMNNPVVLLGHPHHVTTKFSVNGGDYCSIVHITFNPNGTCYSKCTQGMCLSGVTNKKGIPKTVPLQELHDSASTKLCPHLQALFANFEFVKEVIPSLAAGPQNPDNAESGDNAGTADIAETGDTEPTDVSDVPNTEDIGLWDPVSDGDVFFNPVLGKWQGTSVSTHVPMNEKEPKAVQCRMQRMTQTCWEEILDGGMFAGADLVPAAWEGDNRTPKTCECGVRENRLYHLLNRLFCY